jgi:uncharacterized protein
MKSVVLVHGWSGGPNELMFVALNESLKKNGFHVIAPEMPNPEVPEINLWVNKLKELVPAPTNDTYFIGHSIGCQTIMRYLEALPPKTHVGKIVFIAPWFHLQNLEGPESERIAAPWIETPIDFEKITVQLTKLTCFFSDNDEWVPIADKEIFKSLLGAEIIVEHNMSHFE